MPRSDAAVSPPLHAPSGRGAASWLWPREHGAYAELLFPLLTALGLGRFTLAGVALAASGIAAFLAHEPLLVWLGARGGAARRRSGARARGQALLLGLVSAAAGALGVAHAGAAACWALVALVPATLLALALARSGREKTPAGEALVALLLAFFSVPVALAAGLSPRAALAAAVAWSLVFLAGTATVHAVLALAKRGALAPSRAVVAACAVLGVVALGLGLSGRGWWLAAVTPPLGVCAGALLLGLRPRRLRRLGWAMVLAQAASVLALAATLPG